MGAADFDRASRSERALFVSQHRGTGRIAHLDPIPGSSGLITEVAAFRDDALDAHLADVLENNRAVSVEVLGIPNAMALGEQALEPALSFLKRAIAVVYSVVLEKIEGVQESNIVVRAGMQLCEVRNAVLATADGLAINEKRPRLEPQSGFDYPGIPAAPVKAAAGKIVARGRPLGGP
jgi:hypothetical protein